MGKWRHGEKRPHARGGHRMTKWVRQGVTLDVVCSLCTFVSIFLKMHQKTNQNLLNSNHVLKDSVFFLHKRFSALQQGALPWCVRRRKKIHFLHQPVSCPLWLNHIPLDNHKQWQELLLCSSSMFELLCWNDALCCFTGKHYKEQMRDTMQYLSFRCLIWVF